MTEELKVYTLDEVQAIVKVTQRTLYNYIKAGTLKATKIGKYWRVRHNDLQEFLEKGTNAK
jgi:putative molybdopterin biosynthesis protein